MANEILFSNMSPDIRMAHMISAELNLLLRDVGNLRNSPYIGYYGSINGSGSNSVRVRKVGLMGRDLMTAAASEFSTAANTALTDGYADLTCARQVLVYQLSDLGGITAFGSSPFEISPFSLANSISASYEGRFAEMTATAAASLTAFKGTAASPLSVDGFFEGIYELEKADSFRGVPLPFYAVLHPKALTELQSSLRDETANSIANMTATEEMIKAKGSNFVGSIFAVDCFKSSHVTSSGGNYQSWIGDGGCLGYADGVPQIVGAAELLQFDKCVVEIERAASSALTSVVGHAYLGIGIIDDNRGCRLISGV